MFHHFKFWREPDMRAANHAWACDGMEEGTPSRSILLTTPPTCLSSSLFDQLARFSVQTGPKKLLPSKCLGLLPVLLWKFFFLGALPQQGREE